MIYNPWPLGGLPIKFIRPELQELSKSYSYSDPREIIGIFENKLALYAGSKYAVVVDCASNGIFLALKYKEITGTVKIPCNTYVSVPMQVHHAGARIELEKVSWSGVYELGNTRIFDSAARYTKDMYLGGNSTLQILSFQIKKRLPIGKGGAILTDDENAYDWLKKASYDGRNLDTPYDSENHVNSIGWHMYMTPEDAARGILLMDMLGTGSFADTANDSNYPDLTNWLKRIGLIS